jgi:PST family polysaccharide transporter
VLARLADDLPRAGEYLRRAQLAMGYPLLAVMALGAGAAVPVVDLLLGDGWHEVAPVLALLAVAGSAQVLAGVGNWVYLSRGLSGQLLRYTLVSLLISAVCIGVGSRWGVVGVAAGYAAASLVEWPLSLWWLSGVTVVPVRDLMRGALRVSGCAAVAGTVCFAVVQLTAAWPSPARIAAGAVGGLAVYAAAALVPAVRDDLVEVREFGRAMLTRR